MTSLSVSMIVKDGGGHLQRCLQSILPLSPEIVIADTGSTDGSIAVAKEFGARVVQIPWNNDFAEARNCALSEARGQWILSLDADEQLDAAAASAIPRLLESTAVSGFQVTIRNYVRSRNERIWDQSPKANDSLLPSAAAYPAFIEHQNVRLFRRKPEIYFVGRVHESVGPRIRELNASLATANFVIHHFGFVLKAAEKTRKNDSYREMGRQKLSEFPNDWQAHFEQGLLELEQYKNLAEARALFSRACALNPAAGVAWFFLGLTIFRLGFYDEALHALDRAESAGHRTAMAAETRGDSQYNLGKFEEALVSYEVALNRQNGNSGVLAKLCLATVRAGKTEKGLLQLREALAATPQVPELYESVILALVFLNRIEEAAQVADTKLRTIRGLCPGDYVRCASLWAQSRNWPASTRALELGLAAHPGNSQLTRALEEIFQASSSTTH